MTLFYQPLGDMWHNELQTAAYSLNRQQLNVKMLSRSICYHGYTNFARDDVNHEVKLTKGQTCPKHAAKGSGQTVSSKCMRTEGK